MARAPRLTLLVAHIVEAILDQKQWPDVTLAGRPELFMLEWAEHTETFTFKPPSWTRQGLEAVNQLPESRGQA
jgi:hypothetical protein